MIFTLPLIHQIARLPIGSLTLLNQSFTHEFIRLFMYSLTRSLSCEITLYSVVHSLLQLDVYLLPCVTALSLKCSILRLITRSSSCSHTFTHVFNHPHTRLLIREISRFVCRSLTQPLTRSWFAPSLTYSLVSL